LLSPRLHPQLEFPRPPFHLAFALPGNNSPWIVDRRYSTASPGLPAPTSGVSSGQRKKLRIRYCAVILSQGRNRPNKNKAILECHPSPRRLPARFRHPVERKVDHPQVVVENP